MFRLLAASTAITATGFAQAETIRVAIGTQDTTIHCATGRLPIREPHRLDTYLPRTGKYLSSPTRPLIAPTSLP